MRKNRIPLLACALALAMSVTAHAADPPQPVVEAWDGGASVTIIDATPREETASVQNPETYTVGSYYPVEIQTAEDNGVRLLVKTFVVPKDTDPQALIEPGLTRRGVEYQVSDILRRELEGSSESKMVSETVTAASDTGEGSKLLSLFAPTIAYNEYGYSGTLTLNEGSITAEATGTEGYSYTLTDVREYSGLDRNDPYYIPKTAVKNGVTLELADVEWTPMASAAENSDVPSLFTATATYTGAAQGSKASGYLATASYSGEVTKTGAGDVMVSVIYEEVPAAAELPAAAEAPAAEKIPETGSFSLDGTEWAAILAAALAGVILIAVCYKCCTSKTNRPQAAGRRGTAGTPRRGPANRPVEYDGQN